MISAVGRRDAARCRHVRQYDRRSCRREVDVRVRFLLDGVDCRSLPSGQNILKSKIYLASILGQAGLCERRLASRCKRNRIRLANSSTKTKTNTLAILTHSSLP